MNKKQALKLIDNLKKEIDESVILLFTEKYFNQIMNSLDALKEYIRTGS